MFLFSQPLSLQAGVRRQIIREIFGQKPSSDFLLKAEEESWKLTISFVKELSRICLPSLPQWYFCNSIVGRFSCSVCSWFRARGFLYLPYFKLQVAIKTFNSLFFCNTFFSLFLERQQLSNESICHTFSPTSFKVGCDGLELVRCLCVFVSFNRRVFQFLVAIATSCGIFNMLLTSLVAGR